jgi:ribonuclease P protein component
MPQGERFQPRQRLRRGADYRRVLRRGIRLAGPLFVMVACRAEGDTSRLGLTISRRVGRAVVRNRARRLLRETFRRQPIGGDRAWDLVLIPKPEIVGRSQAEVDNEYGQRIRQLLVRAEPRDRRAGAPPAR